MAAHVMKTSRVSLLACAATVGLGTLVGSAQYSPAAGGSWDWLGMIASRWRRCFQVGMGIENFMGPKKQHVTMRAVVSVTCSTTVTNNSNSVAASMCPHDDGACPSA